MTTGKTIALTRWTFVGKVMSLLFNMLCRLVIAFFPRSKHLLISWLQLPSAMILELKKIKSVTVSIVTPSICHEVMGLSRNYKTNQNTTQHNSWVCRILKRENFRGRVHWEDLEGLGGEGGGREYRDGEHM